MTDDAIERRRAQTRERQRRYRARKAAERVGEAPAPPPEPDMSSAPVMQAVLRELDSLPAAKDRPGVAAAALAMARLLDSPMAMPQQPAAARQLVSLLDSLRLKKEAAGGKLGQLRAVPKPGRPA